MQENKQEKSPIKQKILHFLTKKGISQYEFYKNTGVTRGILTQNNGISEDNISRFLAYYPEISAEWLLTGEGEMLKTKRTSIAPPSSEELVTEDKVTKKIPNSQTKSVEKLPEGSHYGLPLIPLSAVAGFPAIDETGVFIESCERYHIPEFEAKGAQFLIRVSGDSMMPTYQNGDIIACRKLSDILFFQWGNIYVIDSSQGQLVKRIFECRDNAEHIQCVSDNTKYPPFNIPTTDIRSLSIIVGLLRIV